MKFQRKTTITAALLILLIAGAVLLAMFTTRPPAPPPTLAPGPSLLVIANTPPIILSTNVFAPSPAPDVSPRRIDSPAQDVYLKLDEIPDENKIEQLRHRPVPLFRSPR